MRTYLFVGVTFFTACSSICPIDPIDMPNAALEQAAIGFQEGDPIPIEWWSLFNDPQLSEWIEKALCQNPTIQVAEERIAAAALIATRVKSALYPYIWLGADVSRQKLSQTGVIPLGQRLAHLS